MRKKRKEKLFFFVFISLTDPSQLPVRSSEGDKSIVPFIDKEEILSLGRKEAERSLVWVMTTFFRN